MRGIRDWGLGIRGRRKAEGGRRMATDCPLPTAHCPLSTIHYPLSTSPRRGLSLLEVLISMAILSVGLLGMAALIPLGALSLRDAAKSDRTGACGRAALRDVKVRRMLEPTGWSPPPSTAAFVIDPLGVLGVGAPLPATLANIPLASGGLPRLTVLVPPPFPPAPPATPISTEIFRWRGDPLYVQPSDWKDATAPPRNGDRPAGLFVQADGSTNTNVTATQAYDATFSWFLTVTPAPTDSTGRLYAVSIVICYQRVLTAAGEQACTATDPGNPANPPVIAFGGGAMTLTALTGTTVNVRENNWIMLCSATQATWYRVVNAGPGGATQMLSVVGPPWVGGSATAVVIDGVTGVYTTTVQLDEDSIWTK